MARIDPIVTSFATGEVSKLLSGRTDIAKYPAGVETLENFLIMLQGGITRRPGSRYIAETKDSSKASRLLPFQYSADQDYVIEAGNEYFKMYSNSGSAVVDTQQDPYTKLLLHANGVDGSKEIQDSGNTGHVVTQVGTATLSLTQAKFGICSLLLDGNSDYITIPDHANWDFGTGAFTVEFSTYFINVDNSSFYWKENGSAAPEVGIFHVSNLLQVWIRQAAGAYTLKFTCPWIPLQNTWYDVAIVRIDNSDAATAWRIYIDGVKQTLTKVTGGWNATWQTTSSVLSIGADAVGGGTNYHDGYIDEYRISNVARYTADTYTPAALTSDANTKLLLHMESLDTSSTTAPKIPTFVGTAQLDTAQYKDLTGYTTTRASLLLDGDSDYVTIPTSDDFDFSTVDWTYDLWVMFDDLPGVGTQMTVFNKWASTGDHRGMTLDVYNDGGNYYMGLTYSTDGTSGMVTTVKGTAITLLADTWYHLAWVRDGATLRYFQGGVAKGTDDLTGVDIFYDASSLLLIGANNQSSLTGYFDGWLDEIRISKGIARWTADFTPPTAEYALTPTVTTEIATPYQEADLFQIQHAHKGDLKYLTHGDYFPRKLSRTSSTAFSLALAAIERGPFLDTNVTAALTITPSADTGNAVTLTSASPGAFHYDAADGATTAQLQVGSLWRIKSGVVKLTAVNSATVAIGNVQAEPAGTAGNLATGPGATADWAEGAFSGYRGYPAVCAFHDGRLYYASTEYEPQKIWGSCVYDYDNFDAGAAADDDAVTFEIATEERVAIRWMMSGNKALTIGSTGATFSAYGSANVSITPGDIQVTRDTNYGSALIAPKRISSFAYYVQRNLQKIRELSYFYDYDVTRAADMNMLAEHILREGDGIVDMDYQQAPTDRLWCVRADGQMAVLTRNPEQDVMGWSRIISGTDSSEEGKYESVCVIPKTEADDQVWVIVRRMINGVEKRFVEFFMTEDFEEVWDAICLDSSLTLDNPKVITGMTNASPGVFSCTAHGFTTGDQVKVNGVILADVAGVASLDVNGTYLLVEGADADKFTLTTLLGVAINPTTATGYGVYISGGEVRKMVTNISGLTHLEGETVQVTMDGTVPTSNSFVVAGGSITLASKAAVVHAGLKYTPLMKTLRPEGGSALGSSQGKVKRIPNVTARFYRTLAAKIGATTQDSFTFTELYTGDRAIPVPIGWTVDGQLTLSSDKPLPLTLISLMPNINVSDL
jgi:hypothetical protein